MLVALVEEMERLPPLPLVAQRPTRMRGVMVKIQLLQLD